MNVNERRMMRLEQAERLLASSLSVKEWCRLNKVAQSTMYVWLKVLREQEGASRSHGWIEVDREESRRDKAIAVVDATPRVARLDVGAVPAVQDAPRQFPPIRVSANGVGIEVPHGACESDVAMVMRAAMAL